jgi:hypothetical protein
MTFVTDEMYHFGSKKRFEWSLQRSHTPPANSEGADTLRGSVLQLLRYLFITHRPRFSVEQHCPCHSGILGVHPDDVSGQPRQDLTTELTRDIVSAQLVAC